MATLIPTVPAALARVHAARLLVAQMAARVGATTGALILGWATSLIRRPTALPLVPRFAALIRARVGTPFSG